VPRSHSCERLPENHKPDAMRENKLLGTEARGIRYVLVLLFIKCVSDKYAGMVYAPITIPPGAGFKDMVALKGQPDIGDRIKKKIVAPLANANNLSDMPNLNDATKLGSGTEMVDRPTIDFSKNRTA
jgi:type I restriction enzyme M protein